MDTTGFIVAIVVVVGILAMRWMNMQREEKNMERNGASRIEFDDIDALFAKSYEQPTLVFLDDPWCPISKMARQQIIRLDIPLTRVDVSQQQDVSGELERRTGIRHESPQILLLDQGAAVWDASHGEIQRETIEHMFAAALADRNSGEGEQ